MPIRRLPVSILVHAVCTAALVAVSVGAAPARASASFTLFETGQVRPLALSPDEQFLFAVNTPDNRLEIFTVDAGGLAHRGSRAGRPRADRRRRAHQHEVWVVNHLSDSVSIVDVEDGARAAASCGRCSSATSRATSSSRVPAARRAFITTAHRGQNTSPTIRS